MFNQLGSEKQTSRLSVSPSKDFEISNQQRNHDLTTNRNEESFDHTIGLIIVAIVCCILGTSLVWICIIFKTRRRRRRQRGLQSSRNQFRNLERGNGNDFDSSRRLTEDKLLQKKMDNCREDATANQGWATKAPGKNSRY